MTTILEELHEAKVPCTSKRECTLHVVTEVSQFDALEPEWEALVAHVNLQHPFLTYSWMRTWWECFAERDNLYILTVRYGTQLVGIAPLKLGTRSMYGWRVRCLEFISNVHTPRCDFLVSPVHTAEAHRLIWSHLRSQERHRWDLILLCQLREDSPTLRKILQCALQDGVPAATWKSSDSPVVVIDGSWDEYFKSLKQKHRTNLQRRLKRLKEQGAVAVEFASGGATLQELVEESFRLEGAAWKAAEGTSIGSEAAVRRFYALLAERFAGKGWLRLHFLTLEGRRIAMQYALSYRNRAFSLKPGYDPAYASYSPSNLLFMLFLETAFHDGVQEYDLLGVKEEWKMNWTPETHGYYWLFVFSNSIISRILYYAKFKVIPLLKRTLTSASHAAFDAVLSRAEKR